MIPWTKPVCDFYKQVLFSEFVPPQPLGFIGHFGGVQFIESPAVPEGEMYLIRGGRQIMAADGTLVRMGSYEFDNIWESGDYEWIEMYDIGKE